MKPILTSEQHGSYKRDGFLVLENFFDPSELEILRADFNGVVDDWANTYYQQGRLTDLFADQSFRLKMREMFMDRGRRTEFEPPPDLHNTRRIPAGPDMVFQKLENFPLTLGHIHALFSQLEIRFPKE